MSYWIIIRGPLGIGKTTVALALAQRLSAAYVSIDEILAQYQLDQTEEETIPVKNFIQANSLLLPRHKRSSQEAPR